MVLGMVLGPAFETFVSVGVRFGAPVVWRPLIEQKQRDRESSLWFQFGFITGTQPCGFEMGR